MWVQELDDRLEVHWITAQSDSGFLRVHRKGRLLFEFTTPLSQSHRAAFDIDHKGPLNLHYGGLTDDTDQHETVIYLRTKRPQAVIGNVDSIYVLGDLHGQFERLVQLLTQAHLINSDLNWIGQKRQLILLGDFFDRGHNVTRTLWFLYRLEKQAEEKGGRVHLLLGNHEIMTFLNDLRYLSGKENLIARLHNARYGDMFHPQHSILGKWLAAKPGILKMNKILFAHGGVHPIFSGYSVKAFNELLHAFINEDVFHYLLQDSLAYAKFDSLLYGQRLYFFFGDKSVFWYRGYVHSDTLKNELKTVLKKFGCKIHIVAHTPVRTITSLYDGRVLAVDLAHPATEMLLLVRKGKKKYKKFRYKLNGNFEPLEPNFN